MMTSVAPELRGRALGLLSTAIGVLPLGMIALGEVAEIIGRPMGNSRFGANRSCSARGVAGQPTGGACAHGMTTARRYRRQFDDYWKLFVGERASPRHFRRSSRAV